jgi:hypothetical protein
MTSALAICTPRTEPGIERLTQTHLQARILASMWRKSNVEIAPRPANGRFAHYLFKGGRNYGPSLIASVETTNG